MKRKVVLVMSLVLLLTVFTACDTIIERAVETATGPIIENLLEDPDSGPKSEFDRAIESVLDEVSDSQVLDYSPEDFDWSLQDSDLSASVGNPPSDTSGIVTAGDITLKYDFTIVGEPDEQNAGLEEIVKEDTMLVNISSIDFDVDNEEIISMSDSPVSTEGNNTPDLDNLQYQSKPVWIRADVENIQGQDPKGVAVVADNDWQANIDIENNFVEVDTDFELESNNFGNLLVVNKNVMMDIDTDETGIAGYILYLQPNN